MTFITRLRIDNSNFKISRIDCDLSIFWIYYGDNIFQFIKFSQTCSCKNVKNTWLYLFIVHLNQNSFKLYSFSPQWNWLDKYKSYNCIFHIELKIVLMVSTVGTWCNILVLRTYIFWCYVSHVCLAISSADICSNTCTMNKKYVQQCQELDSIFELQS